MADVKWIKIVTDIFDDEKILLIESIPEADSIIVIWFKLLCLAGKQNNSGVFMMSNRIAYTDEMLATIFRRKVNTIRLALETFEKFGMIEIVDGVITIPNWSKHQTLDQLENRRDYMRVYMQEYREKQKELIENKDVNNVNSLHKPNVNSLDKNRLDKEEELNINKGYLKGYLSIKKQIEDFTQDKELQEALNQFVLMREKIKKKLTNYAFFRLLNKLDKLSTDTNKQIEILNRSIEKSWSDIYPLENSNKNFKSNKKVVAIPDWYEDYKENLEKITNKPQDLSQEEIEKILTEAKEKL